MADRGCARPDPGCTRTLGGELIATHCEPVLEHDQRTAQAKRYLQLRDQHDGTVWGSFVLASEDFETVATVLEPLARSTGLTDLRSAGQRRADALVEVCEQVLRHGELPEAGGLRTHLSYVMSAEWAAGHPPPPLADLIEAELHDTSITSDADFGSGSGPGPANPGPDRGDAVRRSDHRVLLTSLGQVRGLESLTDSITPTQRRALAGRDQGCAARGCTRPPAMCDAHHLVHREDGGETNLHNLVPLCRRHHVLWHQGRLHHRDLHVPWLTARATGSPVPV